MIYVALLRGINVGGNNKVDMKLLKRSFESVGMKNVLTYINSGNIIFSNDDLSIEEIASRLEKVILKDFKLSIKVLVRSIVDLEFIISKLPSNWKNDSEEKSDVLFLFDEVDRKDILDKFNIKEGIDEVMYFSKVIFWRIDKKNLTKTGLKDIVKKKDLYNNITIRNINTTRKIYELMLSLKN